VPKSEPPGQRADGHLTDDELTELARRGLFGNDPRATDRLDSLIRARRPSCLRYLLCRLSKADRKDAFEDYSVPAWMALKQIAENRVRHPWAYLMTTLTYSAWETGRRWGSRLHHEELRDPAEIDTPIGADHLDPSLTGMAILEWERTLAPREREAWEVLRRQASEDVSRNEAHRRMQHDETVQNRIDRRIARGRQPNGFLDRLRKLLLGEEGVL
jgi:hypothetical protein